jgi:hypothetical protein
MSSGGIAFGWVFLGLFIATVVIVLAWGFTTNWKFTPVPQCGDVRRTGPGCNDCRTGYTGPNCDICEPGYMEDTQKLCVKELIGPNQRH